MQKFNYHSHTYRCGHADLDMKDEDYILEYIKMGFEKIAITDHCPEKNEIDTRPNIRMKYSEKNEYLNSIKKLKEKYANEIELYGLDVHHRGQISLYKELVEMANEIIGKDIIEKLNFIEE